MLFLRANFVSRTFGSGVFVNFRSGPTFGTVQNSIIFHKYQPFMHGMNSVLHQFLIWSLRDLSTYRLPTHRRHAHSNFIDNFTFMFEGTGSKAAFICKHLSLEDLQTKAKTLFLKALLDARVGLHEPRVRLAQTAIKTSLTRLRVWTHRKRQRAHACRYSLSLPVCTHP